MEQDQNHVTAFFRTIFDLTGYNDLCNGVTLFNRFNLLSIWHYHSWITSGTIILPIHARLGRARTATRQLLQLPVALSREVRVGILTCFEQLNEHAERYSQGNFLLYYQQQSQRCAEILTVDFTMVVHQFKSITNNFIRKNRQEKKGQIYQRSQSSCRHWPLHICERTLCVDFHLARISFSLDQDCLIDASLFR